MTLLLLLAALAWIGVATVFVAACIGAGRADRALLTVRRTRSPHRPRLIDARRALTR